MVYLLKRWFSIANCNKLPEGISFILGYSMLTQEFWVLDDYCDIIIIHHLCWWNPQIMANPNSMGIPGSDSLEVLYHISGHILWGYSLTQASNIGLTNMESVPPMNRILKISHWPMVAAEDPRFTVAFTEEWTGCRGQKTSGIWSPEILWVVIVFFDIATPKQIEK